MNELIAIQKIAGWEKLKTLVLDSVSSPIAKRVYNMVPDEFLSWFPSWRPASPASRARKPRSSHSIETADRFSA